MAPRSTWNTWLKPPPLMVRPAAGAMIVSPASVVQLELSRAEGNRLGRGEDSRVEGDRLSPGLDVGQIDGPAQVQTTGEHARTVGGRVHHQWAGPGLEGADVDRAVLREAALVRGDAGHGEPGTDGRTAGQQGHGLGWAAVISQRSQARVGDPDDVSADSAGDPTRAACADEVIRASGIAGSFFNPDVVGHAAMGAGRIPRDDGVGEGEGGRAAVAAPLVAVEYAAADAVAAGSGVADDRAIGEGEGGWAARVDQAAAVLGGVAADGAISQPGNAVGVEQAAAVRGGVAADGAVSGADVGGARGGALDVQAAAGAVAGDGVASDGAVGEPDYGHTFVKAAAIECGGVAADDAIGEAGPAAALADQAAAGVGGVAADGAIGERGVAAVTQAAAGVVADGAIGECGRVVAEHAAAGVVADGAIGERECALAAHAAAGVVADGAIGERGPAGAEHAAAGVVADGAVGERNFAPPAVVKAAANGRRAPP